MNVLPLMILFLSLLLLLMLLLIVYLLTQVMKSARLPERLLVLQLQENQSLRNQLRSPDVATLMGLNQATLPDEKVASNSNGPAVDHEFADEAIQYEQFLQANGYQTGQISDDLYAAGWEPPTVAYNGTGGTPVTFSE